MTREPSAPGCIADRDDVSRGEARSVEGFTERAAAGWAMHHRIDTIVASVVAEPRPAARSEGHRTARVEHIGTAAARAEPFEVQASSTLAPPILAGYPST